MDGRKAGDPICAGGGEEGRVGGNGIRGRGAGEVPFADVTDFATRVDPRQLNRMQIENLVRAGRSTGWTAIAPGFHRGRNHAAPRTGRPGGKASGQIGLFGDATSKPEPLRLPDLPDWPPLERLAFEAEAIGFHLTAHPLDAYAQALRRLGVRQSAQVETARRPGFPGQARRHGRRHQGTRHPNRQPDGVGADFRCRRFGRGYLFQRSVEPLARRAGSGSNVLVTAELTTEGEAVRVTATEVVPLDQAAASAGASIRIWLQRDRGGAAHSRRPWA